MIMDVMECFKLEDFNEFKFQEIKKANKSTKLDFASKFFGDLHDKFVDILKFNEAHVSTTTSQQPSIRRDEQTPNKSTNGSFVTSTPDSKPRNGKNIFQSNKTPGFSPVSSVHVSPLLDFKSDNRSQRYGRYNNKMDSRNLQDDGRNVKFKNRNGPKYEQNKDTQPKQLMNFNLNEDDFPTMSKTSSLSSSSSKPKRRLSTTVVLTTRDLENKRGEGEMSPKNHHQLVAEETTTVQAFENTTLIPAPASAMPRSLWAKAPQEVVDNNSLNSTSAEPISQYSPQPIGKPYGSYVAMDNVTNMDGLDVIGDVYSYLVNEGLSPSAMKELYTMIQLLTCNVINDKGISGDSNFFTNLSNVVYFASRVLQNLSCWLELLDNDTLKLLLNNKRLKIFVPEFVRNLSEHISISSLEDKIQEEVVLSGGITFDEDTDTRNNFPSNNAFNTFKKQRDTFYQLLREWEKDHLSIGWTMKSKTDLINFIIIGCHPTLTDQLRFVRLFVSQLIKTCCTGNSTKSNSQLNELKTTDPDKLKRLHGRLVASPHPAPQDHPSFPKSQEFFRDFITFSSDNSFCVFLIDALYSKIEEVSDSTVNLITDSSTNCDTSSKSFQSGFLNQINTLQILGKFLGFVSYLPYKSQETLTTLDEDALVTMRNKLPERINICSILKQHLHGGSLVVCLSWSLSHLSLMDTMATKLQATQGVFRFLLTIHQSSFECFSSSKSRMFVFMTTMLAWFFELDIFPKNLFYESSTILEGFELERLHASLDHHISIGREVLFRCQPCHSERIHHLLNHSGVSWSYDLKQKTPSRKINPKLAPFDHHLRGEDKNSNDVKKKLEASFFHMHSAFLKRTVEFVCERIFFSWILAFQSRQMKIHTKKAQNFAKDVVANLSPDFDVKYVVNIINKKAEELKNELIHGEDSLLESFCDKAQTILTNLLPESTVPQVLSISTSICSKNIQEKAADWKRGNVSPEATLKEIATELNKQFQLNVRLSDYSVHFNRSNKNLSFGKDVVEIVRSNDGRTEKSIYTSVSHDDDSFNISTRSTGSKFKKVIDRSLLGASEEEDDGKVIGNHSMLFALNASESHLQDLSALLDDDQDRRDKSEKTPGRIRISEIKTKIRKSEDVDFILPSETIISVQDLLTAFLIRPEVLNHKHVDDVLKKVKTVLEDPHKLLHLQSRNILQSLTISVALVIIQRNQSMWNDYLADEFVSIWSEVTDEENFMELFHACDAHQSPILISLLERLHKEGIIISTEERQ